MRFSLPHFGKSSRNTSMYSRAFHVRRDWLMLMGLVVFLSVVTILFDAYLFFESNRPAEGELLGPVGGTTINRSDLKKVLEDVGNQNASFETKKSNVPSLVDPSA